MPATVLDTRDVELEGALGGNQKGCVYDAVLSAAHDLFAIQNQDWQSGAVDDQECGDRRAGLLGHDHLTGRVRFGQREVVEFG